MTYVALGDVVEIKGGGTPSKSNPTFYTGDIPWVTPKDMKVWDITTSIDKITTDAISGSATTLARRAPAQPDARSPASPPLRWWR